MISFTYPTPAYLSKCSLNGSDIAHKAFTESAPAIAIYLHFSILLCRVPVFILPFPGL